ncbi:type II secretion system F family protein [Actinospongicola halichondriae]|uniref:type II secretion system F family protein n=1 Tax=Actinospongicola halichondriae TaxID=3236844 RepID=UPI003D508A14
MTTLTPLLAACVAVLTAGALRDGRVWLDGGRVRSRLDHRPPRRGAPPFVGRLLVDAGVEADPAFCLHLWIATMALSLAATVVTLGGLVAFATLAVGAPVALLAARGRGDRLRNGQLPIAFDMVASSLRGGAALATAVGDAAKIGGRIGPEFETMARRSRDGMPLAGVVGEWARGGGRETALAGAALSMAATVGGAGADAIESAAASLRERAAATAEVAALSVQARLSAAVLTFAPLGFTFLLVSVDPTSARFLLATPAGWACLAVGGVLDLAGALWMHRLVVRAS